MMLKEGIWINDEKMIFYISDKYRETEHKNCKKEEKKLKAKGYREVYVKNI